MRICTAPSCIPRLAAESPPEANAAPQSILVIRYQLQLPVPSEQECTSLLRSCVPRARTARRGTNASVWSPTNNSANAHTRAPSCPLNTESYKSTSRRCPTLICGAANAQSSQRAQPVGMQAIHANHHDCVEMTGAIESIDWNQLQRHSGHIITGPSCCASCARCFMRTCAAKN
jgi:hypothetical protein